MTDTIREIICQVDRRTKSIVATSDAKTLAAIPSPTGSRSIHGQSLTSAVKMATSDHTSESDVLTAIKNVRQSVSEAYSEAKHELQQAQRKIEDIKALRAYLDGSSTKLPLGLPSDIKAASVALASAAAAGVQIDPLLLREFDDVAERAGHDVAKMAAVVDRRKAATNLGQAKVISKRLKAIAQLPIRKQYKSLFERSAARFDVAAIRAEAQAKTAIKRFNKVAAEAAQ